MYRASLTIKHSRVLTKLNSHKLIDCYEESYQYTKSLLKPNYVYNLKLDELSYVEKTSGDSNIIKFIEEDTLKNDMGFLIQECMSNYVIIDIFNADHLEIRVGDNIITHRRNIKIFIHENLHISLERENNKSKGIFITPHAINELELIYN